MNESIKDLVKNISNLTLLQTSELVKALEEELGVSAAAVHMAAPAASAGAAAPVAEKTEFDVYLSAIGPNKLQVIKAFKDATGCEIKAAKDKVDAAPAVLQEKLPKAKAEELKAKLTEVGAVVELK